MSVLGESTAEVFPRSKPTPVPQGSWKLTGPLSRRASRPGGQTPHCPEGLGVGLDPIHTSTQAELLPAPVFQNPCCSPHGLILEVGKLRPWEEDCHAGIQWMQLG